MYLIYYYPYFVCILFSPTIPTYFLIAFYICHNLITHVKCLAPESINVVHAIRAIPSRQLFISYKLVCHAVLH